MRIAIFESLPDEEAILKKLLPAHECIFIPEALSLANTGSVAGCDAVSVFVNCDVGAPVIDALPSVRFIATRSTGFDHIDVAHAKEKGIVVSTVPSYGSRTVAEFTFGLMLNLSRKIFKARLQLLEGARYETKDLRGFDLAGKTLGVVGTGRIGKNVVKIGLAFGMRVVAYDPHPDEAFAKETGLTYLAFPALLAESDIVSLHAPATKENHHLINAGNILTMKKGALLINTARGELIETDALVRALAEGHLGGVGLDVLEGERALREEAQLLSRDPSAITDYKTLFEDHFLMDHPNAILTPHIAFDSAEAVHEILAVTAANIEAFAAGKPQNAV